MIPILNTITALAGTWLEGRVAKTKAKAEAEATVLIKQAESAADWEAAMARNSGQSWKDEWKRNKIENLKMLLAGALKAEGKVGLKMNIAADNLEDLIQILPSMRNPTIASLSQEGWYAIETIIDQHICRDLIPELRRIGAEGIIEYTLNKVIP